jgi:hypothetical protein
MSLVAGVPEIVSGGGGDALGLASTCTANAGRVAVFNPSRTAITMLEYVPASPTAGAPESCPLLVLKVAQVGRLVTANTRVRPCESLAVGVKT